MSEIDGKASKEVVESLRSRDTVYNWYKELLLIQDELHTKWATMRTRLDEAHRNGRMSNWDFRDVQRHKLMEVKWEEFRSKAIAFRTIVESRVTEAKRLKKKYADLAKAKATDPNLAKLLRKAAELIPRIGDGALWHAEYERSFW